MPNCLGGTRKTYKIITAAREDGGKNTEVKNTKKNKIKTTYSRLKQTRHFTCSDQA